MPSYTLGECVQHWPMFHRGRRKADLLLCMALIDCKRWSCHKTRSTHSSKSELRPRYALRSRSPSSVTLFTRLICWSWGKKSCHGHSPRHAQELRKRYATFSDFDTELKSSLEQNLCRMTSFSSWHYIPHSANFNSQNWMISQNCYSHKCSSPLKWQSIVDATSNCRAKPACSIEFFLSVSFLCFCRLHLHTAAYSASRMHVVLATFNTQNTPVKSQKPFDAPDLKGTWEVCAIIVPSKVAPNGTSYRFNIAGDIFFLDRFSDSCNNAPSGVGSDTMSCFHVKIEDFPTHVSSDVCWTMSRYKAVDDSCWSLQQTFGAISCACSPNVHLSKVALK